MSYRVVQWATGNQGVEAIRAILDRPDLDLVGAKVYGDDKEGVDVGVLAGREPCGVLATRDIDAHPGARRRLRGLLPPPRLPRRGLPDPGQRGQRDDDGVPVPPPIAAGPDLARLEAACAEGDSSVHGTGLNPGNLSGVLPLALSGMSRSHREGHPSGAGRLVLLRVDPHHVRQHAIRPARPRR